MLQTYLKWREQLARYRQLKVLKIVVALQRNAMAEVQKTMLREHFEARYALETSEWTCVDVTLPA